MLSASKLRFFLSILAIIQLNIEAAIADQYERPTLSFYGTPGFIDTPSGESLPDAELTFTSAAFHGIIRNTVTFQISPRITGSFRYSVHGPALGQGQNFDRSFDVSYLLFEETNFLPSLSIGIRDLAGTGIYSSEFVSATKHLTDSLVVSGGLGWGRLAGNSRPIAGQPGSEFRNKWFAGKPAFFGGVRWNVNDRLSLLAEYSNDNYEFESTFYGFEHRSPVNIGANYRTRSGWDIGLFYLYGSEIGFRASYLLNPKEPRIPGGRDGAPPLIAHRTGIVETWDQNWTSDHTEYNNARDRVRSLLSHQGLQLEALDLTGSKATVWVRNVRYGAAAQAIGRTARVLTQALPASVENLTIVSVVNGAPVSAVTVARSDLESLEWAPDGAEQIHAVATIVDAAQIRPTAANRNADLYPLLDFNIGVYLSPSLFDPFAPFSADFGVQLDAEYSPHPGLVFSGRLRQPIIGNLNQNTRVSDSVLPHVRSDAVEYDRQSKLELSHLTAEYFFRPGKNLYGRVTAGYLERMFGGVSAEILWKPIDSNLAIGAEINYVRQRNFNVGLGFQDYGITTGHVSGYYQFANGFSTQVDAGRYLAGDWGATVRFERRFANDWRVGVFATLTNVPFDRFGEGGFDKGLFFQIPHEWLTGDPSQKGYANTIHLINRDGGARLDVRNRLNDLVSDFQDPRLTDRWGRFWR